MIPANLLKKIRLACLSAVILTIMLNHSNAEIPSLLNYQGQVINSGTGEPLDSIVSIVFSIYEDSVTVTPLWTETYSSITVVEGLFAVLLGSQNPVPELIFADAERWLGIKVGADSEITPRTRLVSTAYSFHSLYADSAGAGDDGDWTVVGDTAYRATGRVGIGTSSPQAKMDIVMTEFENNVLRVKAATSAETRLIIEDNVGGHGFISKAEYDLAGLTLTNKDPGNVVNIVSTEADINLRVHPSTGATWENSTLTKLHIDGSTGNVGIGTTTPLSNYKLHVNGSSFSVDHYTGGVVVGNGSSYAYMKGDEIRFTTSYGYGLGPVKLAVRGNFANNALDTQDAVYLSFQRQDAADYDNGKPFFFEIGQFGTAKFRLDHNGNVGIGTTNPAQKLHVAGAVTATTYYGDGSNLTGISGTTDNDWTINGSTIHHLTGNVGIGTTSPNYKFHSQTAGVNNQSRAIYGVNTQTGDAGGIGVFGETKGRGKGGVGGCDDTSPPIAGSAVGVWGEASSVDSPCGGAAFGVFGRCRLGQIPGSTPSAPAGGYFEGLTSSATNKSNICMGVFGETWSTALGAAGVKGKLKETNAQGRAIWGEASPNGTGWAGYFDGNVRVTGDFSALGSKSAVLENFEDGKTRYIYSQESPEVWFEDFGEGQLKQGIANILLNALFLETVTINGQHPMKVFVTLNGDCNGVYVKRGSSSFVVKELNNGKSSAQFTYRVVAKRKGFENKRFEVDEKFIASTEAINQNQ